MELQTFFFLELPSSIFSLFLRSKLAKFIGKKGWWLAQIIKNKQMICSMAMLTQLGSWIDASYGGSIL
jgi:hypothetical protein